MKEPVHFLRNSMINKEEYIASLTREAFIVRFLNYKLTFLTIYLIKKVKKLTTFFQKKTCIFLSYEVKYTLVGFVPAI